MLIKFWRNYFNIDQAYKIRVNDPSITLYFWVEKSGWDVDNEYLMIHKANNPEIYSAIIAYINDKKVYEKI